MSCSIDQISFGESSYCGRGTLSQSILFNGVEVGALISVQSGILMPPKEYYQKIAPESDSHLYDEVYESEDDGFVFGCFHTIEKFIDHINFKSTQNK